MSNEHTTINDEMRRAFRANRFTTDNTGRIVRGPVDEEEEMEIAAEVPSKSPGRADGGAQGHVPVDPNAVINNAIRESAGRRGQG